jgi:hypothetical protein
MQIGERPAPRLRAMPLAYRPAASVEIVGREEEQRLAAAASPEAPLELYAPDGTGKTCLLKAAARREVPWPEGVVFQAARRRTLDEIQAKLYAAFWETDVPYLPTPAEVGGFLSDRDALLVIDDCGLDRDDLDVLLESAPRCAVVIASEDRTLWSQGTARALGGLDPEAGLRLLERQLGRPIGAEERPAAAALVERLDGHPQSVVEVAALITGGIASIGELADDPGAIERGRGPAALSGSQRRILEVLGTLGDAPIGAERVAAIAGVPDAARELQELERRGWVKSASPRYRLLRPVSAGIAEPAQQELADRLLAHLASWSEAAPPPSVADEWEAIEAALELGADPRHVDAALRLSLAAERKLAVAGSWRSWHHVLSSGLEAARALGDRAAEAHMLHQLGSRSLCLGADQAALAELGDALGIREQLGDREGAELTRHNLGQLGGGGAGNGGGGGNGRGPWPRRLLLALGALGVVAGAVVAVALATGGGGGGGAKQAGSTGTATTGQATTSADGTTTPPPPGADPLITIDEPTDGATLNAREPVQASYTCIAAKGASLQSCEGTVDRGQAIDMSPGPHQFTVTATDSAGRDATKTINYTVGEPQPTDTDPPSIDIASPSDGASFTQGASVAASYTCSDDDGSGVASCTGSVGNDAPIDTGSVGPKTFTVTALDNAGNENHQTVTYTVTSPPVD